MRERHLPVLPTILEKQNIEFDHKKEQRLKKENTIRNDLSLKPLRRKESSKANSFMYKMESSEVLTDYICHQNRTVHYDFNNPSHLDQSLIDDVGSVGPSRLRMNRPGKEGRRILPFKEDIMIKERVRSATWQANMSQVKCTCPVIVAVDDEPINLIALRLICRELKVEVACITGGKECLEYFTKRNEVSKCTECSGIKMILMDCNMPIMNGFETSLELKGMMERNIVANIPIFACSADESLSRDKCANNGMDGYLKKPVEKESLKRLIEKFSKKMKNSENLN